jgi:hypothetical protein
MKSLFRTFVILTCLLLAAVPLAAQGVTAEIEPDIHVVVPNSWMVMSAELYDTSFNDIPNFDGAIITDNNVTVLILTPSQIEDLLDGDELPETAGELLADVYTRIYDTPVELDTIEAKEIGALDVQVWSYSFGAGDGAGDGEVYVLTADDETATTFFVDVYGPEGSLEESREEIDLILDSIANPPENAGPPVTGQACTVETDTERSATVRVGPGEHRTALTFLKANQPYTVAGRFVEDDATVWYKLVKDEVDPGSSAAELWTSANGVEAIGDCLQVGEAAAPPLRPIVGVRPTTVPGDTNNSGGGEDPGTTVTGGVTPASGNWLFTYNSVVTASCAGGGYGEFPFSDFGVDSSETLNLVAEPDGSGLTIEGYYYPRINETLFLGDDTLADYNVQVYLFPESTTRLYLEIRFNLVIDGFSCSATVSGNGSRR